ncbi:MAG: FHA domain-containing protein [Polyangia bacterium]
MSARLSLSTEEGVVLDLRLGSQPVRIGRAKDNTVRSDDKRTSRHHAIVRRTDSGDYEVEDAGSSFGTMLNGRPIKRERLKHQDNVRCGGLTIQFFDAPGAGDEGEGEDRSMITTALADLQEARGRIRQLIEEHAALRQEVGIAQDAEDRAKRMRDEAQDEVERLHGLVEKMSRDRDGLQQRLDDMGRELRELRSSKSDLSPQLEAAQKQLAEAQKQLERQKARIAELEERDHGRINGEGALKKEVERLQELIKRREQREVELNQVVKPALMRIGELQQELERQRIQLAKTEAELQDARRGR